MNLDLVSPPPAWTERAACSAHYGDRWYPEHGHRAIHGKRTCFSCPVVEQCREYGMDEFWGTWGGLTGKERRALGRGRGRRGIDFDIPEADR